MELSDFAIGERFWTQHGAFRCTDIGTRVIVAVKLGPRPVSRAENVDGAVLITKRIDDDASWLSEQGQSSLGRFAAERGAQHAFERVACRLLIGATR